MEETSGIFRIDGHAYPARFSPRHWLVFSSYEPEHEVALKTGREFDVKFESGVCTLIAVARCIATDPEGIFQIRLKRENLDEE